MSLYALKNIIELVPETAGIIKQACVETEFPTTSRDATISSALEITFLTKVANQMVDENHLRRVSKAVELYDVRDQIEDLTHKMMKAASLQKQASDDVVSEVRMAEYMFEGSLSGIPDMEKLAQMAEALIDNYGEHVVSPSVKLYGGEAYLNKEAAVAALNYRAQKTGNQEFIKIAHVIQGVDALKLSTEDKRNITSTIMGLEKSAQYVGDIYKDIFMTKLAGVTVNLGKKTVPVEKIIALGSSKVSAILGSDVGSILKEDPLNMKHALEALPLAEKKTLAGIV